jgi:hypothetical protein
MGLGRAPTSADKCKRETGFFNRSRRGKFILAGEYVKIITGLAEKLGLWLKLKVW